MKNILILFAHPRLEKSQVNASLLDAVPRRPEIRLHDLYEEYADFNIDIRREKELLLRHDIIIWHHPFYWYSAPPLLKQWIDMVLEFKWAYGPGGTALTGKYAFNVITSGGTPEAYARNGRNRFTVREFLAPFEQTARLCHMTYLPPFTVQGTHRLTDEHLRSHALAYRNLLTGLADGTLAPDGLASLPVLNEAVNERTGT